MRRARRFPFFLINVAIVFWTGLPGTTAGKLGYGSGSNLRNMNNCGRYRERSKTVFKRHATIAISLITHIAILDLQSVIHRQSVRSLALRVMLCIQFHLHLGLQTLHGII